MKNKRVVIYSIFLVMSLLFVVMSFSFAYLFSNRSIVNNLDVNVTIANGIVADFTVNGTANVTLSISGPDMLQGSTGLVKSASPSQNLEVKLTSDLDVTCSYAISWKWLSDSDAYEKSITEQNEFTVQGTAGALSLGPINVPHTIENSMVLGRYTIRANNTTTTQSWNLSASFTNLNVNQDIHENKTYKGQIVVENAHCYKSSSTKLADYIISKSGSSGTDSEGNKWYLYSQTHSSDSKTDYRYAGANPNNFIEFNGEMWRIVGVMPVDYDSNSDSVPDQTGNLVKIVRNTSFNTNTVKDGKYTGVGTSANSSGSNNWSDSQIMIMFNPLSFLNSGYTVGGTVPFLSYVRGAYVYDQNNISYFRNPASLWNTGSYSAFKPANTTAANGFTAGDAFTKCTSTTYNNCFKPFSEDAQGMVATVKWNLGGVSTVKGTAETIYGNERGNSVCKTLSSASCTPGNDSTIRPTYWYGKVGLVYASDFGFAVGGSDDGTTYSRSNCLTNILTESGDYRTHCGLKNFLVYKNATADSKGTAVAGITMTYYSTYTYLSSRIDSGGYVTSENSKTALAGTRPSLYLNPDTIYVEGDGSYNNPYRFL